MATIKGKHAKNLVRIAETVTILLIVSCVHIFLPALIGCTPLSCTYTTGDPDSQDKNVCYPTNNTDSSTEVNVKFYTCYIEDYKLSGENGSYRILRNRSYSESATLFYGTGEQAVYHLYSKNTHRQFSYTSMACMLVIYFFLSCYAAGTYISCGIVVPMLLIGGLYGRMIGRFLVDQFGIQTDKYWAWMDPGAFALLGSVSFFAGVTRLTMSLTVIMVEITNDPLYHALLEFKCIPFLTPEPLLIQNDGSVLSLDLFTTQDAMTHPVKTVNIFQCTVFQRYC